MCLWRYCARRPGEPRPENGKNTNGVQIPDPKIWGHLAAPKQGPCNQQTKKQGSTWRPQKLISFRIPSRLPCGSGVDFWHRQVPEAVSPLLLNLDETCIRFFYTPRVGMRLRGRRRGPKGTSHVRHATRAQLQKGPDTRCSYMQPPDTAADNSPDLASFHKGHHSEATPRLAMFARVQRGAMEA